MKIREKIVEFIMTQEESIWNLVYILCRCINTLRLRHKWLPFCRQHSKMVIFLSKLQFHLSLFPRVQQYSSIGLDNGLAPAIWQAIIWTNDCQITDEYMHYSASMSLTCPTDVISLCDQHSREANGPTLGPSGANRTQVGSMLAPWALLSGMLLLNDI